jgi:hypothetical protein
MRSLMLLVATSACLVGCTTMTVRRERSIEVRDDRLMSHPYGRVMLLDVQKKWEELLIGRRPAIYGD